MAADPYAMHAATLTQRFLRATASTVGTAEARTSYGNSVCLSVCLLPPGTDSSPGEIETPGFHNMIAQCL